jgi:hypothetical protein
MSQEMPASCASSVTPGEKWHLALQLGGSVAVTILAVTRAEGESELCNVLHFGY